MYFFYIGNRFFLVEKTLLTFEGLFLALSSNENTK